MKLADKMRQSRDTVQQFFMEYNEIRQKKPNAFIAFFEGYDAPYYLPFIVIVTGLEAEQVICRNKRNVIDVYKSLLGKDVLKNAKTGFFVDRDFDDNSAIMKGHSPFYVTKGYSVENYYCTKSAMEKILKCHMHYNSAHKDYDTIVNNYVDLQRQYNEAILDINAWVCCLKNNKITVDWSLDKSIPDKYVTVDCINFVITKKYDWSTIHHDFPATPQPSMGEVKKCAAWIMLAPVQNLRGKYEFSFLMNYLTALPQLVNDPSSGFEKHQMKFSMGQNEALSALAQYADKETDLEEYIRRRAA